MNKGFACFLLSFFFSLSVFSQRDTLIRNTTEVSAIAELAAYEDNMNFIGYGFHMSFPVGEHLGLNYKFMLGNNSERSFFLHSNMGSYVSVLLLTTSGNVNNIGYLAVILLIVPEGVSFHIPITRNFRLTPFINPLGVDYWHDRYSSKDYTKGSFDIGIKPTFVMFDKVMVAPSLGYKLLYSKDHEKGIELGISIGYRFKKEY